MAISIRIGPLQLGVLAAVTGAVLLYRTVPSEGSFPEFLRNHLRSQIRNNGAAARGGGGGWLSGMMARLVDTGEAALAAAVAALAAPDFYDMGLARVALLPVADDTRLLFVGAAGRWWSLGAIQTPPPPTSGATSAASGSDAARRPRRR